MSTRLLRAAQAASVAAAAIAVGPNAGAALEFKVLNAGDTLVEMGLTPIVITAEGPVEDGDADRLRELVLVTGDGLYGGRKQSPEVHLNSPGGDAFEGIELGRAIRELKLATFVPEGAICASACTTAFLGGVERGIAGNYLIHAAFIGDGTTELSSADVNMIQEDLQKLAVAYVSYAEDMIGDPTVAEQALYYGLGCRALDGSVNYETGCAERDAGAVPDTELRDWNVITVAVRPSQRIDDSALSTLRCDEADPSVPDIVQTNFCRSLTLMRLDLRLSAALSSLDRQPEYPKVQAEQARWTDVRNRCERRANFSAEPSRDAASELLEALIVDGEDQAQGTDAATDATAPSGTDAGSDGGITFADGTDASGGQAADSTERSAAEVLIDSYGPDRATYFTLLEDMLADREDVGKEAQYATGELGVRYCLSDAYERRVAQLEGLVAYYEGGRSYLGESWDE